MQLIPISVSASVQTLAFALLVGALAVVPMAPVDAQKGKPPSDLAVTVTFADRDGDRLVSDGEPVYLGGVVDGAGSLRLELGATGRTALVTLGTPDAIGVGVTPPIDEVYQTDAVLYIQDVRNVPVGSTQTSVGRIGLGTAYPDHAIGFRVTTAQGIAIYGTPVCVSRVDNATWIIASSCTDVPPQIPAPETSDMAGLFQENLKGKINHRFKANYAVPFQITVTCTGTCAP